MPFMELNAFLTTSHGIRSLSRNSVSCIPLNVTFWGINHLDVSGILFYNPRLVVGYAIMSHSKSTLTGQRRLSCTIEDFVS